MLIRLTLTVLFSLSPVFCLPVSGAEENPVEHVQDLALRWTGLKRQNDVLISNWRKEQPVQEQQLSLLTREKKELTSLIEETSEKQDQVEKRRLELLERQSGFEQEQAALERALSAVMISLQQLQGQFPPPLAGSWDELMPRALDTTLDTSERLQVVVEMLGQLDDFNRKVTLNKTEMTMADGQDYLITQIYLGISHGWYVSNDGKYAAAGRAGPDGWQWFPVSDAGAIGEVAAILERKRNTALVTLPLALSAPEGDAP